MPTGYSAVIDEGCSFEEYVWRCARGMGAFIVMRDDPMDARVPERFEPSPYYAEALKKAQAELIELRGSSPEAIRAMAAAAQEEAARHHREYREEQALVDARYTAMEALVEAWEPPTPDHVGFKAFMLEQIRIGRPYASAERVPEPLPPEEWHARRVAEAERDVAYFEKNVAEEVARANERNEWIRRLRESVPQP